MPLSIIDLGLIPFKPVFLNQIQIHKKISQGESQLSHALIFCQHPHTITLGKKAKLSNIIDRNSIKQNNIDLIFELNRGGDITYHGPGQLMGYLIFDLKKLKKDISWFLDKIEQTLLNTLSGFNLPGNTKANTRGAWVKEKKIASIGIGVEKWISLHGFALNINTDLSFFDIIRPCGMDVEMTSMEKELGLSVSMEEVKRRIVKEIYSVFGFVNSD